jgi:hypothetical protein
MALGMSDLGLMIGGYADALCFRIGIGEPGQTAGAADSILESRRVHLT